jgi:predicted CXXCH cytochrome family protein
MTKRDLFKPRNLPRRWKQRLVVLAGALVLVGTMISCRTVTRTAVTLPNIPGAEYLGTRECANCHEEIVRDFQTADHARLITTGPNALHAGCESCHGPSSLHVESGGEVKPPYSFSPGRPQPGDRAARLVLEPGRANETVCYQCHANVRGQFNLPHHHPVPEGKMSCSECHSPHKGSIHAGGGTSLFSRNETCLRCHSAQRGPHVFEHEAMREGCTTCHNPHGSVHTKMLTARDANLCLKCHFQQVSGGRLLIGGSDHSIRVQQGTCWSAGCHEAVHGSRVNSSLRY